MQTIERRRRILFVCAEDSCRSAMAEGWARQLHGRSLDVVSAGVGDVEHDALAVRVLAEVGVDITGVRPTRIDALDLAAFDHVVVLGNRRTPIDGYPNVLRFAFEDPQHFAASARSEEEAMIPYRRVRNELRELVESLPGSLEQAGTPLAETS